MSIPSASEPVNRPAKRVPLVVGGIVLAAIVGGVLLRTTRNSRAHVTTSQLPVVGVMKVHREAVSRDMVFDSELRPFQEVDLHAKVAGYVQSINVDIGDRVKEGDLIAILELPEAQNDLERAVASQRHSEEEIHRAEAAYEEAKLALNRLAQIDKARPNLIAQQDIDVASSREKTTAAALAGAQAQAKASEAEVKKLKTMLQYARIVAPFDGVVTERFADKGALIQAGTSSSTQAMPLVRLSDNRRLRLVFPVSVSFVATIQPGKKVEVEVPGLHKKIEAAITRTSQKVNTATRTMDAEVDIANNDYSLIPGMYAAVRADVETRTNATVVPIEAVSRGKNATVYVINNQNVIEEHKLKLGIEAPDKVEALEGVNDGDLVMVGNRAEVKPGQKVTAKLIDAATVKE